MSSHDQLRARFQAKDPRDALDEILQTVTNAPEGTRSPLLTIYLASGTSFKGYVLDAGGDHERHYLFIHEIKNETDGSRDLCYVNGNRIEALTVWDAEYLVDEGSGLG